MIDLDTTRIRPAAFIFNIQRMEDIHEAADGQVDVAHSHDYYTVIWIQEGSGEHLIDFNRYPLAVNDVFFVSPRQVHRLLPSEKPYGWVITFSRDFLAHNHINEDFITEMNLFGHFEERPPLQLPVEVAKRAQVLLSYLSEVYKSDAPYRMASMSAYLKLFLIDCHAQCQLPAPLPGSDQGGSTILREFKKLITEHFYEQHQVQEYAQRLHISAKYLNQVVKSLLGKTAKELIQEKIILNAKRSLRFTDHSIKEIAYELGFQDPLYFSSFFKKCTGESPSRFRKGGTGY
ncbi:AraC family transcriptional regulator [Lewinella cohaerens]|uniref:AraC family transcriptional regulator n=1 Tax=Lewinella cohaerens TaxID=70995 RepID=UPI0003AACB19|nr:AraC family transcriptional regulator [Lewinella cohaerens]